VVILINLPNYYLSKNDTRAIDLSLFILACPTGRDMEDGPFDISDDNRAVLDASRYASSETPVHDIFFIINGNLKLRAEVLNIIVIKSKKAEYLVEFMGVRLAEFYFFSTTGQYPLSLSVELCARYGIGIYLDDRLNGLGVVLNAVRWILSILFRSINNVSRVFPLVHFYYLFLQ
jgi:hypothetical protein